MAKATLKQVQSLQQKLSQQNIILFKMMEMNLLQFDEKVKEELDVNPALEDIEQASLEANTFSLDQNFSLNGATNTHSSTEDFRNTSLDYYKDNNEYHGASSHEHDDRELFIPVMENETLIGNLTSQLTYTNLSNDQILIGEFIIGSLDDDGYLRRSIESIVDDLSFRQNFMATHQAVLEVLEIVQDLDPPGIAARNLQECLSIQLKRKKYTKAVDAALTIVSDYFEDYSRKNYDRILKKLKISQEEFDTIKKIIQSLNPSPGIQAEESIGKFIIPDFFVYRNDNKLELELHSYNKPNLAINKEFVEMLKKLKADKKKTKSEQEVQEYAADKINKANQFISLIKERQETMVIIMNCILELQEDFFLTGDESNLKPMGLKNIAEITNFDISTISRVTSSKYIQTEFGIFGLKFLFSEGLLAVNGEEISNRKIMKCIEEFIDNENKNQPYSDDDLTKLLEKQGYIIARRTVAKYRENLKIASKHQRRNTT
jgi:RNA polymerase sigma-54 factor